MIRRERDTRVRLDGMSEAQLEIVRRNVFGALVGKAGDLRLLHKLRDPKGAIREVSALGRLAFWLEHGEIVVPDKAAREVAQGLADGVDAMNEWDEVARRYEEAMAEHDALRAFVAHFADAGSGGTQDDR
ncbi:MAG: hypothetical protein JWO14_3024 [Solirubrobacterales bacterium]|nr:hypothetical protein [Solirubrobacterales bacterium]